MIGHTQNHYQVGVLPAININKKLTNDLKLNFQTALRQIIYKEKSFDFKNELLDFTLIASKKVGLNNSLAGGYLLRVENDKIIHRSIQQFILTPQLEVFKIAHRFRTDQTFESRQNITFRVRYKISCQVSLNGQSLDSKAFYLKLNNAIVRGD